MTAILGILLGNLGGASGPAGTVEYLTVEYLVVAGGGAGAQSRAGNYTGGGGGAGGMLANVSFIVDTITPYTVTVGAGGASNSSGNNSVFASITSTGGGAGGGSSGGSGNGFAGGSGGGGTGGVGSRKSGGAGIVGQGSAGGRGGPTATANMGAGGGGGAGGAGGDGINVPTGGAGGIGLESSITGISTYYAGGGGGSSSGAGGLGGGGTAAATSSATPTGGSPNTGGGGGAGSRNGGSGSTYYAGSLGGSGVVVIAYPTIYGPLQYIDAGLTYTVNTTDRSDYRVYRFTQGTGSVSWATGSTVPGQVMGVTAESGYGSGLARITFGSAYNGGSAITSYTVVSNPGNITLTVAASPITVSGLTDGVAYTFTVYATNAIGNGRPSVASNSITNGDVYYSSVGLLLKSAPYGNRSNDTFVDDGAFSHPVGAIGNPTLTNFNPYGLSFGSNVGSGYFGGSRFNDGLVVSATVGDGLIAPQDQDFTYEAWIYPLSLAGTKTIWSHRASPLGGAGSFGGATLIVLSDGIIRYYIANAAATTWQVNAVSTGHTMTVNVWQHVALIRSGNTVTAYLNGTAGTSVTVAAGSIGTSGQLSLMCGSEVGGSNFNGYMAGFRLVRESVVIPPAGGPTVPPTNFGFTPVLINFLPAIYDASPGSLVATASSIRLPGDTYTTDTYQWAPTSAYFDGNTQLTVTNADTVLQIGTADFTVEMWIRPESRSYPLNQPMVILDFRPTSSNAAYLVITLTSSGLIYYGIGGVNKIISTTAIPLSAWTHIAVVRSSGTTTLYLNGVQEGTFADTTSYLSTANRPIIGGGGYNAMDRKFIGYMQDLRITIGVARYTGTSFTLPTYAFIAASAPQ